jgi:hypothetical protein
MSAPTIAGCKAIWLVYTDRQVYTVCPHRVLDREASRPHAHALADCQSVCRELVTTKTCVTSPASTEDTCPGACSCETCCRHTAKQADKPPTQLHRHATPFVRRCKADHSSHETSHRHDNIPPSSHMPGAVRPLTTSIQRHQQACDRTAATTLQRSPACKQGWCQGVDACNITNLPTRRLAQHSKRPPTRKGWCWWDKRAQQPSPDLSTRSTSVKPDTRHDTHQL